MELMRYRDLPNPYLTGLAAVVLAVLAPVIPLVYCGMDVFAFVVPVIVAVLAVNFVGAFIPPSEKLVEGRGFALLGSALLLPLVLGEVAVFTVAHAHCATSL